MEKVVKCNNGGCGRYFMQTEKARECPFCYTVYVEAEEKASAPTQGGQASGPVSGGKDKKVTAKTQKEPFKIWKKS